MSDVIGGMGVVFVLVVLPSMGRVQQDDAQTWSSTMAKDNYRYRSITQIPAGGLRRLTILSTGDACWRAESGVRNSAVSRHVGLRHERF